MFSPDSRESTWIKHVAQTYLLDEVLVHRLLEEFLELTGETVHEYVVRVHLRYQSQGMSNNEIFQKLKTEVAATRFREKPPTQRQIRRWIYG